MTENLKSLKPFIESLECGEALTHENITLLPVNGEAAGADDLDYILAEDAIGDGLLTITEISESGSVPELQVTSTADKAILLIDGEELVGAKQNRILNTSILLPAAAKARIPVSCVEQGRWRHVSSKFAAGGFSPAELRALKSRSVGRNLRASGRALSDQGEVWNSVADRMARSQSSSPTMSLHDIFTQRRDTLDEYISALPYPANARGVIAAIAGKFAAFDLFDKPQTLERLWQRLVTGYAADAICADKAEAEFTAKGAAMLLEHLGELVCQPCVSAGLGEDWRFESQSVVGQALVVDKTCVHLSVFPNSGDDRRAGRYPMIQRPSRRNRRRQ